MIRMFRLSQTLSHYSIARENKHIPVNNTSHVENFTFNMLLTRDTKSILSLEVLSV